MQVSSNAHLTYCSNIHPGETWEATFQNLKRYTTKVKEKLSADSPFGIGLRLSAQAAQTLLEGDNLIDFRDWLDDNDMYVFTMNAFPYGGFHQQVVKDKVHAPDWTTSDRLRYTINTFDLLKDLIPLGLEGSISTSPLSYRHWHDSPEKLESVKHTALENLLKVVSHLQHIKETTGKHLHLDIEPEPDGVIESADEFIAYFKDYLLRQGGTKLASRTGQSLAKAEESIRDHVQLCHDVCHFAVGFEDAGEVISKVQSAGIRTGKIQISAALKGSWQSAESRDQISKNLRSFDEPVYLHQAMIRPTDEEMERYCDLAPALERMESVSEGEVRTHYHVPLFTETYDHLQSTQSDIVDTLDQWLQLPFTQHLEVETYTWDVLPDALKVDIVDSISREMDWVLKKISS